MIIDLNASFQFYWNEIAYRDFDVRNSFSALQRLNTTQENSLAESRKELEQTIRVIKENNAGNEEAFVEAYIHHATYDDEIMIDEIERLQRYSLVMSIFAFYEAQLKSFCAVIEEEFKFSIKLSDLGSFNGELSKCWTYLNKVYGLSDEKLQELFKELDFHRKVRNVIVHQDGSATAKNVKGIAQENGISFRKLGDAHILEIEKDVYVMFLLKKIEHFFLLLFLEADKRYKELKG